MMPHGESNATIPDLLVSLHARGRLVAYTIVPGAREIFLVWFVIWIWPGLNENWGLMNILPNGMWIVSI